MNLRRISRLGLLLGVAWLFRYWVLFSANGAFDIDEFCYSHGGWLVARGLVPFRDFFFGWYPFVGHVLSLTCLFLKEAPAFLWAMRAEMQVFILLIFIAAFLLNRNFSQSAAYLAVLMTVGNVGLGEWMTQIRPDTIAFALFLVSVAVLTHEDLRPKLRAAVAGILISSAGLVSLKAAFYGLPFIPALIHDFVAERRGQKPGFVGDPSYFLISSAGALLVAISYLYVTGSFAAFVKYGVEFIFVQQRLVPPIPWTVNFHKLFVGSYWLFPLAVIGLVATWRISSIMGPANPDFFLVPVWIFAFFTHVVQNASHPYSLIPFAVITVMFAARGVSLIAVKMLSASRRWLRVSNGLVLVVVAVFLARQSAVAFQGRLSQSSNEEQVRLIRTISKLTSIDDKMFDNAGQYGGRYNASYFYFNYHASLIELADELATRLPTELIENKCVGWVYDFRFNWLPKSVQNLLTTSYVQFNESLWLWGSRFEGGASTHQAGFRAIKTGDYFVYPPKLLERGRLTVDGAIMTQPIFSLQEGIHYISYEGPVKNFIVAWLPRNGKPYRPS